MYVPIALFNIRLVVGETASHYTTHDKVERLRPGPVLFEIVELERAVRRDAIEAGLISRHPV